MATIDTNIPPRIYHTHDPDGIVALWKTLVSTVMDAERTQNNAFATLTDPDRAPMPFVEILLASLGNPFRSTYLTDLQKRKLARLLIAIYRQKGTTRGVINVVRFLTGIEITILDPHAGETWQVGYSGSGGLELSEVGYSNSIGGRRAYRNMLDYSEAFDNAAWTKTSAVVTADTVTGPSPWNRLADSLNLSSAGATVKQSATPRRTPNEVFTASVWLKAASAGSITGRIQVANNPSIDGTSTTLALTTSWQRLTFQHETLGGATNGVEFVLTSAAGFAPTVYAWGAQLVRDDLPQPYVRQTNDGRDRFGLGPWGYHFFIQSTVTLTDAQEQIIALVADFMKPSHTHYTILNPTDVGAIDHWEVGLSSVGVDNFVHA